MAVAHPPRLARVGVCLHDFKAVAIGILSDHVGLIIEGILLVLGGHPKILRGRNGTG